MESWAQKDSDVSHMEAVRTGGGPRITTRLPQQVTLSRYGSEKRSDERYTTTPLRDIHAVITGRRRSCFSATCSKTKQSW